MKKLLKRTRSIHPTLRFDLKMKLTTLFLLTVLFTMNANNTYSQKNKATINLENTTIERFIDEIEKSTDFRFVYKVKDVDLNRKISISAKDEPIQSILKRVFDKGKTAFSVLENQIYLTKAKTSVKSTAVKTVMVVQFSISGTVTDKDGNSLPGASIVEKGTTNGTQTDFDGNFVLEVNDENAILVVSYIGFATQEVPLNGQTTFTIALKEDVAGLDEVVVIGYGSQKRSSITGAIATMKVQDVENIPVTKLSNALAGRLSGVFVNEGSGAPGYASSIQIRSANTWKDSGADPLYVIDGVITSKQNFDALDQTEVKSISVLKDVASAAIYGARGGNGVILVTTNSGDIGKFKLNYNYSYSVDKPSNLPEYVGAKDMVRLHNYASERNSGQPYYGEKEVAYFSENDPALGFFDQIYRDPTLQKHSISASGGSDKIRYFLNGSSVNQTAFVKNAGYKKYQFRSNINVDFTDNLSGFFNLSYHNSKKTRFVMQEDNRDGFEVDDTFGKFWSRIQYQQPHSAPKTSDGKLINAGWIGNVLGFVEEGGLNTQKEDNIDMIMAITYKVPFVKGLTVSGKYSPSLYNKNIKHYEKKHTLYNVEKEGEHGFIYTDRVISSTKSSYPSKERLVKSDSISRSYQLNFSANYEYLFGKHKIGALVNVEMSEGYSDYFYGGRENFPLLYKDQIWATGSSRNDSYVDGNEYEYGRMSYIGRISYDYDSKYFMKATLRRDGSMLFAPDHRWGNFPSLALGWVVSNEDFMQDGFFDFLKFRGTWGLAGNDAVGGWEWAESYSTNGTYMMGTSSVGRVKYNGIVNEKLTWEKTREVNIGFDSRFFDGVILNFEYYNRHNYDILASRIVSLPISFGGDLPPENYGEVDGKGFEVEVGYRGTIGELNYGVKGNLSYATNKIVKIDIPENVRDVNNPIGRSTDHVKAFVSKGIIRTQDQLDAIPNGYTIYGLTPELGDIWFEDVSGVEPNVPDGKIDDYDLQVIKGKHYNPPYTYGFNLNGDWKGFGLDVFFQGSLGVSKMYDDDYAYHRRFVYWSRPPSVWLDSWSEENVDGSWPRPDVWGNANNHLESTFWLKNGNYLRLKHVNLSYSLPKSILSKLNISNATLMMSGTNLLTFSGFKYYDPSIQSMSSYPTMKSYTLGIQVSF